MMSILCVDPLDLPKRAPEEARMIAANKPPTMRAMGWLMTQYSSDTHPWTNWGVMLCTASRHASPMASIRGNRATSIPPVMHGLEWGCVAQKSLFMSALATDTSSSRGTTRLAYLTSECATNTVANKAHAATVAQCVGRGVVSFCDTCSSMASDGGQDGAGFAFTDVGAQTGRRDDWLHFSLKTPFQFSAPQPAKPTLSVSKPRKRQRPGSPNTEDALVPASGPDYDYVQVVKYRRPHKGGEAKETLQVPVLPTQLRPRDRIAYQMASYVAGVCNLPVSRFFALHVDPSYFEQKAPVANPTSMFPHWHVPPIPAPVGGAPYTTEELDSLAHRSFGRGGERKITWEPGPVVSNHRSFIHYMYTYRMAKDGLTSTLEYVLEMIRKLRGWVSSLFVEDLLDTPGIREHVGNLVAQRFNVNSTGLNLQGWTKNQNQSQVNVQIKRELDYLRGLTEEAFREDFGQ